MVTECLLDIYLIYIMDVHYGHNGPDGQKTVLYMNTLCWSCHNRIPYPLRPKFTSINNEHTLSNVKNFYPLETLDICFP